MTNYFIDVIEITLPVSAVILLLAALSPFIKQRFIAKWRYYMWLFIAVRVALPFKAATHKAVIEIPNVMHYAVPVSGAAAESGISLQQVLMLIYFGGVLLFFLFQAVSWFSFSARVKRWERPADKYILSRVRSVGAELGIKRKVRTVVCKSVSTPMMTGVFRPKLILPDRSFSEQELNIILRHELIHLRNNDIPYKLVLMAANGMNWFNPVIYLMVHMANRDVELVCDSEVVRDRDIEYRQAYCRTILLVVHKRTGVNPPLSTGFVISKQIVKERIEDILSLRIKKRGIAMFTVVALSVGAAGSVIGFARESIRNEVEENLGILERTTPAPEKNPEPQPDTGSVTAVPQQAAARPAQYSAPAVHEPVQNGSVPETNAAEKSETAKAAWWSDDMSITREVLEAQTEDDSIVHNVSSGESSAVGLRFEDNEDLTMRGVYYVEPNKAMTVYHNGGIVQVADAVTGELVYDSAADDNTQAGVIEAGDEGMYYKINVSQAEDGPAAELYITEK